MANKPHKQMDPLPLHRVAVVRPFVQLLADIGVPVEQEFRRCQLPHAALDDVNNYVPSHRFLDFVVGASRRAGIKDLGFRVGVEYGPECADPRMTELLTQSPSLYQGLLRASALTNRTVSNCQVGIMSPPRSRFAYFYHRPSCGAENPASEQIGWFGLLALLGMVRVFAGPRWYPPAIGVMTRWTTDTMRDYFPGTRIRYSPHFSFLALDKALLDRSPCHRASNVPAASRPDYSTVAPDFAGTLRQLLASYVHEQDLHVEIAAELCGTSKRTLQRRLAAAGTCYSEVVDQARFLVAREMLLEPGAKVVDIAHALGYSHATHFARAFRRIAGVSPRAYRRYKLH